MITFDLFSALIDSRTGASRVLAGIAAERRWAIDGERLYDEWDRRNKASQRDEPEWIPFAERLRSRSGQLKGALTDQTLISGIGNAYSDEILHAARLSPFKMANRIDDDELIRLYDATHATLTDALERQRGQKAATMKGEKRSGLMVHARTGLPCPVCGDTVREVSFADTSLQYCPTCQTGGKPLADRRMSKLLR